MLEFPGLAVQESNIFVGKTGVADKFVGTVVGIVTGNS
jgi:hypothetical protein